MHLLRHDSIFLKKVIASLYPFKFYLSFKDLPWVSSPLWGDFNIFFSQSDYFWSSRFKNCKSFFFFFFFFLATPQPMEFLSQGSNLSCSYNLPSYSNAGSFNPLFQAGDRTCVPVLQRCQRSCWATAGTPKITILIDSLEILEETLGSIFAI